MTSIRIIGVFILVSTCSCITILQPLATFDSIRTDDRLVGNWVDETSKSVFVQQFVHSSYMDLFKDKDFKYTKEDSIIYTKSYVVKFIENNLNYIWLANLTRLNDQYYVNLLPDDCLNGKGEEVFKIKGTEGEEYMATSSIARLEWKNKNLVVLRFLNGDRIKEIILNGRARIRYEYEPLFNNFLITASSLELQEFLKKYGNSESLFEGGKVITLNRQN